MSPKHALKTAVAAVLTLLFYRVVGLDESNEIWAVVSAVIVMQSNLGSSWKASINRVQGTAIGAFIGALAAWLLGVNYLSLALAVGLTLLICSRLKMPESLRLGGATAAVVILAVKGGDAWALGWHRFLDVATGIAVALLTQLLILPSRAGRELQDGLVKGLQDCGQLYQTVVTAYLQGHYAADAVEAQRQQVRVAYRRILDLLQDIKSEPMGHRPEDEAVVTLVDLALEVREHVLALDHSARDRQNDAYFHRLEPHLTNLATASTAAFAWLAAAVPGSEPLAAPVDLNAALTEADAEFARLREQHATRDFSIEEVLRFCSFFFNVRAVAQTLSAMQETLEKRV